MAAISTPFGRANIGSPWLRVLHLDYKWQLVICAMVGTFMTMLDQTIVNVALPKIATVFGVAVTSAQLVITGYMLALAVIIPATGYLSDTFGTKRLYLITMLLFTGGSALCALAWDNNSLIAFRVIQGLGGGMMGPLGMTMIFKAVPLKERNTVMGFFGMPMILAPILGPGLGGYIVEYLDWRVIFTLNVPVGLLGTLLGVRLLRESERTPGLRFDWRGFLLSAVGFGALLLAFSDVTTYGWTDPGILTRFAVGIMALAAWIWVELTDPQPLLELRLFKDPVFTMATLVGFVLTAGLFGAQLLVPLFLQNFRGLGAAESGLLTMWQALAMVPAMPLAGRLVDRFGARPILLVGMPFVALANWQFTTLNLDTPDSDLRIWLMLRGLTMGMVMMPAMTTAMNAAPLQLMSRASSLTNVTRQVFASFGTAIYVSVLQSRQIDHYSVLAQTVRPDNLAVQQLLARVQEWVVGQGGSLVQAQAAGMLALVRDVQLTAAVMAFDDVFRITALSTLVALLPALFLRDVRPGAGPGQRTRMPMGE